MMSARTAFTALLCLGAGFLLWQTLGLGRAARLAPLWVIVPTLGLLLVQLVLDLCPRWAARLPQARALDAPAPSGEVVTGHRRERREAATLAWLAGLAATIQLVDVVLAIPLFLFAYLVSRSREPWWRAAAVALAAFTALRLAFPNRLGSGLITDWLSLRFPSHWF